MANKERCTKRAMELAIEYIPKYWGCAQITFTAIYDALCEEGIELSNKEGQEAIFKSLVALSGGHGNCGFGNCGAFTGASVAIGLASGIGKEEQLKDSMNRWITQDNVAKTVAKRFKGMYGGYSCNDVTWKRFGKAWNHWIPEAKGNYSKEEKDRGCLAVGKCTMSVTAGWAVGVIIDLLENPRTIEQVKQEKSEKLGICEFWT